MPRFKRWMLTISNLWKARRAPKNTSTIPLKEAKGGERKKVLSWGVIFGGSRDPSRKKAVWYERSITTEKELKIAKPRRTGFPPEQREE